MKPFFHRNSLAGAPPPPPAEGEMISEWFERLPRVQDVESFPMESPDSQWAPWKNGVGPQTYTPRMPQYVPEEIARNRLMPEPEQYGPY